MFGTCVVAFLRANEENSMVRRGGSREELFAMVWERSAEVVAKELGVSGVALGKLCARLQVPKLRAPTV